MKLKIDCSLVPWLGNGQQTGFPISHECYFGQLSYGLEYVKFNFSDKEIFSIAH